jgi:membrane peptidoglycan carboxypeptidase
LRSKKPEDDAILEKAGLRIPIFGKTGTTNDYVNATYVGYLPYPKDSGSKSLSPENAYTIAAYVGYDTNIPMRRRGFKVAGGTGALPAWIEIAQTLIREQDFAGKLDWKTMLEKKSSEVPFDYGSSVQRITVPVHGASLSAGDTDGSDDSRADLNSVIDDYASSANAVLRVALAGKQTDGFFSPVRRVSPISVRVKKETPQPAGSAQQPAAANGLVVPKDATAPEMIPSPPAVPSDLAKNSPPVMEPTPAREKVSPEFSIPKFTIDDTFNSEDPVN